MSSYPSLRPLFHFPGWVIRTVKITSQTVSTYLRRDERYRLNCPHCKKKAGENRRKKQCVLDLPIGIANYTFINYEAIQGYCTHCKYHFTLLPPGIDHHAQATRRLMYYVCRLCRFMPTSKVIEFLPISTSTARRWDKIILRQHLPEPNFDNLRYVIVDEKSIGRHHHYLTVVINGDTGEVLHIAEGKKKDSFKGFFAKLTSHQINNIEAVAMDRAGAYKAVVKECAPKAEIVFDKFHIVANLNQAVDKVRRDEWREANRDNRTFIKGQRYNLFRHPEHLSSSQATSLDALFEENESLFEAYLLKDALRNLWTYIYPKSADKYLSKWISWVNDTDLEPLIKFAKGLDRDRKEILGFIKHRITSAKLEAFNNTIDRIVRKACGYRDLEYLYLKIRQEAAPPVLQT